MDYDRSYAWDILDRHPWIIDTNDRLLRDIGARLHHLAPPDNATRALVDAAILDLASLTNIVSTNPPPMIVNNKARLPDEAIGPNDDNQPTPLPGDELNDKRLPDAPAAAVQLPPEPAADDILAVSGDDDEPAAANDRHPAQEVINAALDRWQHYRWLHPLHEATRRNCRNASALNINVALAAYYYRCAAPLAAAADAAHQAMDVDNTHNQASENDMSDLL